MISRKISSKGPGTPGAVPAPGATSSLAPRAAALPKPPKAKNTRDYGKKEAAPAPSPSPFGPDGGF